MEDYAMSAAESQDGLSRRELMRRGAGLGGAVAASGSLSALLAACGGTTSKVKNAQITAGGVLKAAVSAQPDTLDPAKSPLSSAFEVFTNINSGLVGMDTKGNIVPRIAAKWASPDDRTVVFDLRNDVRFHNGDPVRAKDVKYSFDRILDKKTASPWAANLSSISGTEVLNPTRVAVHLKEPYAPLLTILARNGQILSQRAVEDGDPARKPVGCGPFAFVEWVNNDHITLRRNPSYFLKGLPHLDGVRIRFMAASPSAVQTVQSHELNYIDGVPPNLVASVRKNPAFNFITSANSGLPHMLAFNLDKPPVNNKLVRQAIAWAIDRKAIQKVAYFNAGQPGSEEVGRASKWYSNNDPYQEGPDLAKAKQLMQQAGVRTPLTIEFMVTSAQPDFVRTAEIVRDQLKPIGIDLKVAVLEPSIWLNRLLKKNFVMTMIFNETVSDPDQMYSLMVLSGANINVFNYKSPAADSLITAARSAGSESRRKQLYARLRQIVFTDLPFIYVHYATPTYLADANVVGATARPTLELAFETIGFASKKV
jgi:peptide/nickel transport system substrate-binding protein